MKNQTFTTGAKDHETNEFILCVMNDAEFYDLAKRHRSLGVFQMMCFNETYKHFRNFTKVDFDFADKHFEDNIVRNPVRVISGDDGNECHTKEETDFINAVDLVDGFVKFCEPPTNVQELRCYLMDLSIQDASCFERIQQELDELGLEQFIIEDYAR